MLIERRSKWPLAAHLAALHQLLMCSRVLVGGGGVLSSSNGLRGRSCSLLGSILGKEEEDLHLEPFVSFAAC